MSKLTDFRFDEGKHAKEKNKLKKLTFLVHFENQGSKCCFFTYKVTLILQSNIQI